MGSYSSITLICIVWMLQGFQSSVAIDPGLPKFSLIQGQVGDRDLPQSQQVPSINVTFATGETDRLELWHHYFNEEDRNQPKDCRYFGRLANDPMSCVAVTGCFGSEDVEISLRTDMYETNGFGYIWNTQGEISEAENIEELRLEGVHHNDPEVPIHARNEAPTSRSIKDDRCLLKVPPPTQELKLKVAYEENYFNYHGRDEAKAIRHLKAAFVHTQTAYCDPSLGTKVHINVQNADNPIFLEGVEGTMFKSPGISHFRQYWIKEKAKDPSTDLMSFLMGGGGGVAWVGPLCNPRTNNGYNCNGCTRSAVGCGGILRHEIGHNFNIGDNNHRAKGRGWDCGLKGTVMAGNARSKWSPCAVMKFRELYSNRHGTWCMEEYPTACTSQEATVKDKYFQIKDAKTGLVLGLSEKYNKLVFSENKASGNQMWKWLKNHDDPEGEPDPEWHNIVSKVTGKALDVDKASCNGDYCNIVLWSVHSGSNQMFKKDADNGNRIVSKYGSNSIHWLSVRDGKLVLNSEQVGSNSEYSVVSIQDAPEQKQDEAFIFDQPCPEPPPPFEGTFVMKNKASKNMMTVESASHISASPTNCGASSTWIWEQEDDTWGLIKLASSKRVLTVNKKSWNLEIKDLHPESTRNYQRWRWVGEMLVSKVRPAAILTADKDSGVMKIAYSSVPDRHNQEWVLEPAEELSILPSEPVPEGFFLIKNKESGQFLNGQRADKAVVSNQHPCAEILDTFEWEADMDGVYGRLKSTATLQYLTVVGTDVFLKAKSADLAVGQKWRVVRDMLVSMQTEDDEMLVLSHVQSTNKLKVGKTDFCNSLDHKWSLVPAPTGSTLTNKIPDRIDSGAFGIEFKGSDGKVLTYNLGSPSVSLTDFDCDENEEWLWEWDDSGEWGYILPKMEADTVLGVGENNIVVGYFKEGAEEDYPEDIPWRILGQWIIPQALPDHALAFDEARQRLVVKPIRCDGDDQLFRIFELNCKEGDGSQLLPEEDPNPPTPVVAAKCEPYSIAACKAAVAKLDLYEGGKGYDFVGSYAVKGCYYYTSGSYSRYAYYGTGGSTDQTSKPLSGKYGRPEGFDCKNDE